MCVCILAFFAQVKHAAAFASEVHLLRPQLRYTDVLRAPTA